MRLKPQTYTLTAVTHERRRLFQRAANAELLIATVLRYRDQGRFHMHGFVVMPDHLHVLLTPSESIEKTAQLIKGGLSFAIRHEYRGDIWQNGYFAHRVTGADDFAVQLEYIAANPLRRGYEAYPHVHTAGSCRLDPMPPALNTARGTTAPAAEAPFQVAW